MTKPNQVTAAELKAAIANKQTVGNKPDFELQNLCGIDFKQQRLEGANFVNAAFSPEQSFREATLNDCVFGREDDVKIPVQLNAADFYHCSLQNAKFYRVVMHDCKFVRANLTSADLSYADCAGCDFTDAIMEGANLKGVNLYLARFNRTRLSLKKQPVLQADKKEWEAWCKVHSDKRNQDVHRLEQAASIYLELRANFLSIGAYSDASWSYVQERRMRRAQHHPRFAYECHKAEGPLSRGQRTVFDLKHFFLWAADGLLLDGPTIYAEGLGRTFLSLMLAAILFFPLLYGLAGGIKGVGSGSSSPIPANPSEWYLLVLFSLGNLVQGYPGYEAMSEAGRILQTVEQFFGVMMIGVLGFVLGRKINRG